MTVKIERLDDFGRGIGYVNGKIVFIENALPDELVECKIINDKKNYYEAKLINIISKSPRRIIPKCKYFDICGGCQLQHLNYDDSTLYKKEKINDLFKRNELFDGNIKFIKNENDFYYRNKIELKVVNGQIGFYQSKSHDLVEIDECLITKSCINNVINDVKKLNLKNASITIRSNFNDEVLIIINSGDNIDINYTDLVGNNKIAGIMVNGKTVYNESFLIENINDMYFKVSYNSFFQVNHYICSKLFEIIADNIDKNSIVADLYCGVGTLSIVASKKALKVYGVEIVENAILNAIENSKINKVNNTYFMVGNVNKILPKIKDNIDTIIIDPPRSGLDDKTRDTIIKMLPSKIIYTSCNPQTLLRDLKILKDFYEIKEVYALDMFSYTYHVETVCILEKKNFSVE